VRYQRVLIRGIEQKGTEDRLDLQREARAPTLSVDNRRGRRPSNYAHADG
jgi:hypothetical protein